MNEGPAWRCRGSPNGCAGNVANFLMKMRQILLWPIHSWVWLDAARRASNLLRFAETEAEGGRDLVRAAELTPDPVLRTLFLFHARDEQRHAELFRRQGSVLQQALSESSRSGPRANWLAPGERGLDDLRIEELEPGALLAFLHLSEKSAATEFASYRNALERDPSTRAVFDQVLRDEVYHMKYTLAQLVRVSPQRHRVLLWRARLSRLWKGYLRLALALAGLISGLVLTMLYFCLLPPFGYLAKRAARKEPVGWLPISSQRNASLDREY
jgi:rubrerythrin